VALVFGEHTINIATECVIFIYVCLTTPSFLLSNRLLDILADRKAKKGLSGHVLINGRRQPHNFKCASAYVVQVSSVCIKCREYGQIVSILHHTVLLYIQDDIVVGTLSVKENLMFSAALRLPKSYSWLERKEKVDKVIDELGLRKVAKSRVCLLLYYQVMHYFAHTQKHSHMYVHTCLHNTQTVCLHTVGIMYSTGWHRSFKRYFWW